MLVRCLRTQNKVTDVFNFGAPCGFSGRFENGNYSLQTKMKISFTLYWRMKMWRTQFSQMLKSEDHKFSKNLCRCRLQFKIRWRSSTKLWRKWRPHRVQGAWFWKKYVQIRCICWSSSSYLYCQTLLKGPVNRVTRSLFTERWKRQVFVQGFNFIVTIKSNTYWICEICITILFQCPKYIIKIWFSVLVRAVYLVVVGWAGFDVYC